MNKRNSSTPPLTPASEFRRIGREGLVITLESSGRVVRMRSVQLMRMLKAGKIPDPLTAYVASLVYGGDEADTRSIAEQAVDWLAYLDLVVTAALMHPRVVDDPQEDDEIAIEDLEYAELVEISGWARNPLDAVRPFRGEQTQPVDVGTEGGAGVTAAE